MTGPVVFAVEVDGLPTPGGSFRCIKRGNRAQLLAGGSDSLRKRLDEWRAAVEAAARQWIAETHGTGWEPIDAPLEMSVQFAFERPKTSTALLPSSKRVGDLDKLVRSTADALSDADVIRDDSRIVDLHAKKRWVRPAGDGAGDAQVGALIHLYLVEVAS